MAESDTSVPMGAAAGDALAPVRPGAAGAEAAGGEGLPAGLTTAEAMERLERGGPNMISETEPPAWRLLAGQLWGVIPGMLEAAVIIDLVLARYTEAAVIGALLLLSAGLGFTQERRGRRAVALLRSQLSVLARVRRDGRWQLVPAAELVPGDVVHVRAGDLVPADVGVGEGVVSLDQSQLTGESLPAEAGPGAQAFAGSRVARGEASGVVTATADRTRFGRTAQLVQLARAPQRMERFIVATAKYLFALDAVLVAVVLAASVIRGASWSGTLLFALMLLVAAVPVALPAMFAMSAAVGASMLARNGVLATRLSAVEDAATMDVLCVDKTGTITQNSLQVAQVAPLGAGSPGEVLRLAALASDEATQDPIDLAVLAGARARGVPGQPGERLRFAPFDPDTRRSEAELRDDGAVVRVVKGAPATIAGLAHLPWGELEADVARLSRDGARVLAVASGTDGTLRVAGLVALADPPRADSAALVGDLTRQGVRVVLVTGDGEATARAVAAEVGITGEVAPAGVLDAEVPDAGSLERYSVFAGVLPEHKFRLVRALQHAGHVVGMTGDGVNDAPALGQANVGIAVAAAADVAKASASLVLTRPGLGGILTAIKGSRTVYQRMQSMLLAMVSRKASIPPFLVLPLLVWGVMPLTPLLIVLFMLFGDVTTFGFARDRVIPSPTPDRTAVRSLVVTGLSFASLFLAASLAVFWTARYGFGLTVPQTQTAVFAWLVFAGGQSVLYIVRTRGVFWARPRPTRWLVAASGLDVALTVVMAAQGWLMTAIPLGWIAGLLAAAVAFLAIGNGLALAAAALIARVSAPARPAAA